MIDVSKVAYNVYAVLQDGTRLNVTPAVMDLGWEEGESELSSRFSFTVANVDYNGSPLSSTIKPNTAIVVTASAGGDEQEVASGKVIEWNPQDGAAMKDFSVVCYDDLYNLQKSQDDRYIKAGTGTKSALNAIFSDWGIPAGEYKGPDKPHAKTLFKAEYLGDIITELLDDAEKHGADNYVIRMSGGKVSVLPINANETVYHFDEDDNLTTSGDKISTADLVTRVKVIGLEKKTQKRSVEATLDGKTEYGIRQRIYTRSSDDTAAQAKSAAQKTLDEKGEPTRKTTLKGADLPFIRKGDKIRAAARTVNGFCTVLGVQHDAANRTMTMTVKVLDEDPAGNKKDSDEYKVGDIVNFAGGSHYKASTDTKAASTNLSPGKAKITIIKKGAKHPYHLIYQNWAETHVYGWVDEGTFSK